MATRGQPCRALCLRCSVLLRCCCCGRAKIALQTAIRSTAAATSAGSKHGGEQEQRTAAANTACSPARPLLSSAPLALLFFSFSLQLSNPPHPGQASTPFSLPFPLPHPPFLLAAMSPEEWYKTLPPLTKIYWSAAVLTTILTSIGAINPMQLYLDMVMVFGKFNVRRGHTMSGPIVAAVESIFDSRSQLLASALCALCACADLASVHEFLLLRQVRNVVHLPSGAAVSAGLRQCAARCTAPDLTRCFVFDVPLSAICVPSRSHLLPLFAAFVTSACLRRSSVVTLAAQQTCS